MADEIMGTAAQEALRIAETYLPRASLKQKKALAHEIVEAISLCERELIDDVERDLKKLFLGR